MTDIVVNTFGVNPVTVGKFRRDDMRKLLAGIEQDDDPNARALYERYSPMNEGRTSWHLGSVRVVRIGHTAIGLTRHDTTTHPVLKSMPECREGHSTEIGIYILPELRRRGIGASVMRHYIDKGMANDLHTTEDWLVEFYRKMGYREMMIYDTPEKGRVTLMAIRISEELMWYRHVRIARSEWREVAKYDLDRGRLVWRNYFDQWRLGGGGFGPLLLFSLSRFFTVTYQPAESETLSSRPIH